MARFRVISGHDLPEAKLRDLEAAGLVRRDGGQLITSAEGRLLLNAILRDLLV
jgi:oxygen-independent coproporphyrinogen-3 oxidase